jgi:hypothetical protein
LKNTKKLFLALAVLVGRAGLQADLCRRTLPMLDPIPGFAGCAPAPHFF